MYGLAISTIITIKDPGSNLPNSMTTFYGGATLTVTVCIVGYGYDAGLGYTTIPIVIDIQIAVSIPFKFVCDHIYTNYTLCYINFNYMSPFYTPDPSGIFGLSLMQVIGIGGMCWMGIGVFIMAQMVNFEI